MRGLHNANLAFQFTVESFNIPNRVKIPPFHWSAKHSLRLHTTYPQFENKFNHQRSKGHAYFQSRRRYHHHSSCFFSHLPHTLQAADERSLATSVDEPSSPLKETYSQPPETTDASAFPRLGHTPNEIVISPSENQWSSVVVQAHPVPATSNN